MELATRSFSTLSHRRPSCRIPGRTDSHVGVSQHIYLQCEGFPQKVGSISGVPSEYTGVEIGVCRIDFHHNAVYLKTSIILA